MPTLLRLGICASFVLNAIVAVALDDQPIASARSVVAGGEQQPGLKDSAEFRRPILVAMTWERTKPKPEDIQPAWRSDGTQIDADELAWLHKELKSFEVRPSPTRLVVFRRPLVLIFQVDERAQAPQMLKATGIVGGKRFEQCACTASGRTFLARSVVAPSNSQLPEWPAEIDLEVQIPIGEPELMKRIERIPADPLQLDRGVRWYLDRTGSDSDLLPTAEKSGKAVILERTHAEADPLVEIFCRVLLKGKPANFTRFAQRSGNLERQVVQIVQDEGDIEAVEFYRRKYRIERYEKLPIRAELMPE